MNATVITTGPGVIIDTATASMNCRSVSQWNRCTTPPYRNGTIASPLPNTNSPAPAKYTRIFHSTLTDAGPPKPATSPGAAGRKARARVAGARRHPHEVQHAAGDDGNDRGADPVEQPLHPRQPAETDVQFRQNEDHEKRGGHERDPGQRRAERPATHPPEVDRKLCRERPRGQLRKRKTLVVLPRGDPAALFHQVLLHVSGQGNRPAEPQCAKP